MILWNTFNYYLGSRWKTSSIIWINTSRYESNTHGFALQKINLLTLQTRYRCFSVDIFALTEWDRCLQSCRLLYDVDSFVCGAQWSLQRCGKNGSLLPWKQTFSSGARSYMCGIHSTKLLKWKRNIWRKRKQNSHKKEIWWIQCSENERRYFLKWERNYTEKSEMEGGERILLIIITFIAGVRIIAHII